MRVDVAVEIARPPQAVWPVMVDVERWHEWTASITDIKRLEQSAFGVGSRVRIRQPRLAPVVWRVKEFEEARFFTWETRSPGVATVARHAVRARNGGSIVELTIDQTGLLAPLLALLLRKITRRYMEMEAQGLKRRCEGSTT
jgi:hypothetical protein